MRILIIKSNNKRKRHLFVSDVLEAVDITVDTFGGDGFRADLKAYDGKARSYGYSCAILIGADSYFLWHFILIKLLHKIPVYVRLGGDPVEAYNDRIKTLLSTYSLLRVFKVIIDSLAASVLLRSAEACITVSHSLAQQVKHAYKVKHAIIMSRPIEPFVNSDNKARHSNLNLISIVNLAYKEKYEGICRVLHALEGIEVDITWKIAGGGPYESELRNRISEFNNQHVKVEYLGHTEEVNNLYRWGDVFVYASRLDWMPNVLLEAKSHGLPVLLENYEPLHEIFPTGGAIYFNHGCNKEFSDCIEVLFDEDERQKLGEQNIRDIKLRYSKEALGQIFMSEYAARFSHNIR